jgi:hypothetical protein
MTTREAKMTNPKTLEPNDFPVETDNETLKTQNGKKIASAVSEPLAEHIAERLNEQAHREEEDRWSP